MRVRVNANCRSAGVAPAGRPGRSRSRPGVVLLAVLVAVALLMLVGYQFSNLMSAEFAAAQASNRVSQGRALADSGIHYAAFVLSYPQNAGISDGDTSTVVSPSAIYHNAAVFHVYDPQLQGFFSILAPRDADDPDLTTRTPRFGVVDESGKININALLRLDRSGQRAREMLQKLPNMTPELADAILTWTQTAGSSGGSGDLRYIPKQGPYESVEELLLLPSMTPRLLLGNDFNRNGTLEPEENDSNDVLDPGLSRYFTIYSRERNLDSTGQPRVYINEQDLQVLHDNLLAAGVPADVADFIVQYRAVGPARVTLRVTLTEGSRIEISTRQRPGGGQPGPSPGGGRPPGGGGSPGDGGRPPGGGGSSGGGGSPGGGGGSPGGSGGSRPARTTQISSLYELIDAQVEMQTGRGGTLPLSSPLRRDDLQSLREKLPILLDKVTTSRETELPPKININTAPREVLLTLPGLEEADVEQILDHRPRPDMDPASAALYRTPAWLLTEAGFDLDTVRRLEQYITTRSSVFRVQVAGYHELGGPVARLEAVIDTNGGRPRFVYWRDITELGLGFDVRLLSGIQP